MVALTPTVDDLTPILTGITMKLRADSSPTVDIRKKNGKFDSPDKIPDTMKVLSSWRLTEYQKANKTHGNQNGTGTNKCWLYITSKVRTSSQREPVGTIGTVSGNIGYASFQYQYTPE